MPSRPRLVSPDKRFHRSFLSALAEYHAEGHHPELPFDKLEDLHEFGRYVTALRADVERPGEPDRYLAVLGSKPPEAPEGGHVPQTILWWARGDEFLGRVSIRHRLNEGLLREGGNIGYEVRPSARGQGHASAMLAAALPIAASLGIDVAHLDCLADNMASRRVIEKNGGRLDHEADGNLYFLVPTTRP